MEMDWQTDQHQGATAPPHRKQQEERWQRTVRRVLDRRGESLPQDTRSYMEPRFGFDFGRVRVHADAQAAESARELRAAAYTTGGHIVFGAGEYAPQTTHGRRLLAHELAHVVQQRQASFSHALVVTRADSSAERQATQAASRVATGGRVTSLLPSTPATIARQPLAGPASVVPQAPATLGPTTPSTRGESAAAIALGEVGVKEVPPGSNRGTCTPGATRGCVDAYTGGRAEPWCAHFVSWAFEQTGESPFGHVAAVSRLRSWGRSQGWYVARSEVETGAFVPQAGDIFTKPRYDGVGPQRRLVGGHTGLVIRYDPASRLMETVEGNRGDAVVRGSRTLSELDGFIRVGS